MKRRLKKKEYVFVASMLFGLVFGAGNLIFPAAMGQRAGAAMLPALIGFCTTGVGLPLLAIAAISITASESLFDICAKVGRRFSYAFTCLLYLSIGPLFAIPRTATVSFQIGISPFVSAEAQDLGLFIFTFSFFTIVLYFSLRPSGILIWVGKVLTPLFLLFLSILIVTAVLDPMGSVWDVQPEGPYAEHAFFTGFLEGYNTMDVLAALAFGNILVNAIKQLGLSSPKDLSYGTIVSGAFSTALMALSPMSVHKAAQSMALTRMEATASITSHPIISAHPAAFCSALRSPAPVLRPPLGSSPHAARHSPNFSRARPRMKNMPFSSRSSRSPCQTSDSATSSHMLSLYSTSSIPRPLS